MLTFTDLDSKIWSKATENNTVTFTKNTSLSKFSNKMKLDYWVITANLPPEKKFNWY